MGTTAVVLPGAMVADSRNSTPRRATSNRWIFRYTATTVPSGASRQLVLARRPSVAPVRSGKLPATRWIPWRTAVAAAQLTVGPSSDSDPARNTSGVPATEKYSGSTTSSAPAAAASATKVPAAVKLASRSSPAVVWMAATRMSQGRPGIGHNDPRRWSPGRPRRRQEEESAVSFEDSDVVRSAVRVEGFRDDEFNYQLIRAIGLADYGGSTVGECLAVVAEIADGSPSSWTLAFERLAQRVEERGRDCLAAGRRVSGRDHLLRASTYYRTAEYYAGGAFDGADGPGARSRACFSEAASLLDTPVERLDVPFAGGKLPGYLVRPPTTLPA